MLILEYLSYEKGLQPFNRNDRVFSSHEREDITLQTNGKKAYTLKRSKLALCGGALKALQASTVETRLSTKAVKPYHSSITIS